MDKVILVSNSSYLFSAGTKINKHKGFECEFKIYKT